jgi:hypothetical protein
LRRLVIQFGFPTPRNQPTNKPASDRATQAAIDEVGSKTPIRVCRWPRVQIRAGMIRVLGAGTGWGTYRHWGLRKSEQSLRAALFWLRPLPPDGPLPERSGARLFRRAGDNACSCHQEQPLHRRIRGDLLHRCGQPIDHVACRTGWNHESAPRSHNKIRLTGFGHGWDIGQCWPALRCRNREHFESRTLRWNKTMADAAMAVQRRTPLALIHLLSAK